MPPPSLGGAGDIMFYVLRPCVRPSVRDVMLFSRYLWYALTDFHQTFVNIPPGTKMN